MDKILEQLACPSCHRSVRLVDKQNTLICIECGKLYEIKGKVPIMLDDASREELRGYLSSVDGKQMVSEYNKKDIFQKLYKAIVKLTGGSNFHIPVKKKFDEIINSTGQHGFVLEIGSGTHRLHEKIINVDIDLFENVDVVSNGAKLPFLNESVDAIFILAVLEHTRQPHAVIQECYRVLKRGGTIYAEVPFVFRCHSYPTDFWRYSLQGLEELFRDFDKQEDGVCVGPSSGLLTFLTHYVSLFSFSNNDIINRLLKGLTFCLFFPIKYLDIFLLKNKRAHELAAGLYYMGRKR